MPERCDGCHGHIGFTLKNAQKLVDEQPTLAPLGTRSVKVLYDAFSHAQHLAAEGIEACTDCHARVEGGELPMLDTTGDDRARKDFAVVDFERCMGCHDGAVANGDRGEPEFEAPHMNVTWHGATDDDSGCLACHENLYAKKLRSIDSDVIAFAAPGGGVQQPKKNRPKLVYEYQLRHHGQQLAAAQAVEPGSCARCHRREDWLASGEPRRGPFWHRLHMESLDGNPVMLSRECAGCHEPQADAGGLARSHYAGAPEDSCAKCHQGNDTHIPRVAKVTVIGAADERIDFPHDVHLRNLRGKDPSLEKGCMSCHEFRSVGNAEYESIPVTRPEARDCSGCHGRSHDRIAGGDCDQCHGEGDPVYTTAPHDDGWPVKDWPALNAFDHFSAGHTQVAEERCENCHEDTRRAKTITEIHIPSEDKDSEICRGCHVEEKKRFHWR